MSNPQISPTPQTEDEIELATPEAQRAAIDAAIVERLGDNWRQDWLVVHDASDLVRLHRDKINLDFQADLLAEVEVIEREANPVQLSGRLVVWSVLGASLLVAIAIAFVTGVFGG